MEKQRSDYDHPKYEDILSALKGDQEAVLNIYLHYEALARYLLFKYVRGFAVVNDLAISRYPMEDLCQELYLKLERSIRRFKY